MEKATAVRPWKSAPGSTGLQPRERLWPPQRSGPAQQDDGESHGLQAVDKAGPQDRSLLPQALRAPRAIIPEAPSQQSSKEPRRQHPGYERTPSPWAPLPLCA